MLPEEFASSLRGVFSPCLDAEYVRAQREADQARSRVMLGYVGFCFPAFFALDLVVFPEHWLDFGIIRGLHALVAIPAFLVAHRIRSETLLPRLAMVLAVSATLSIALMCSVTGGFASSYIVGMIICFLAIATIEVFRPAGLLKVLCGLTAAYCVLNYAVSASIDARHVTAAMAFTLGAVLFCVVAAALHEIQRRQLCAAKERLMLQNTELERARRHQGQFLSTVSHELRSPMNSILGFIELLEEREQNLHEKSRRNLGRMKTSALRQLRFINDLLDLSKAEAGRMEIEIQRFNLTTVVQDVAEETRALISGRDVTVVVDAPAALYVNSDETRVRQILVNLASNAAKFTESGQVLLRVVADSEVVLEVSDTGIGIPAEAHQTIFEAFRQGHRGAVSNGTGLGLSIVSHLAQLLGSRIELESQVGQGSTFRVRMGNIEAQVAAA